MNKKRLRKKWANCPTCFHCPDKKACNLDLKRRDER